MTRFPVRRLAAAGALAIAVATTVAAPPAAAQFGGIVYDPTNYAQNVLTAARSLEQINNQIQQIQNQATSLLNEARNLTSLPFSQLEELQAQVQQTQRLLGEARSVEPAIAGYRPTDPQIAFHLARFIEQVRSLPADPVIVRQNWLRAYEFATDRGALARNEHARANDPFAQIGRVQVAVDVSSVIRASPDSFRVAWTERRYQDSQLAATERWSAILTIAVQPPRDPDALRANPLGIFVHSINWSKELGQ